jgi:hypothetical protein
MSAAITWIRPEFKKAGVPQWLITAGISDDGTVFVPARIAGNETAVTLAAGWDGNVAMAIYRDHAFLPVEWMVREYPKLADDLRAVEKKVRAPAAGQVSGTPSDPESGRLKAGDGA